MSNKTYSREISVALLLWLGYLSYDPTNIETLKVLVYPFMGFVLAAFSFKQSAVTDFMQRPRTTTTVVRGWDQRSSQYPIRENEYPDNRSDK